MVDGKKIVAVDMLWLRPGRNGGTESFVRNILDGLMEYSSGRYIYYLIASEQNKKSLAKYAKSELFKIIVTPVNNESQVKRVLWSNINVNRLIAKYGIDLWFSPVYSKPFHIKKSTPVVTSIMDIQAMHFPEYFSKGRNAYFRASWKHTCKTSNVVVTISEFCKEDIAEHFDIEPSRIRVIYPAIKINSYDNPTVMATDLTAKYGVKPKEYYYTVSSLAKHKNVFTILRMMKRLKERDVDAKLVITGVNVNASEEIRAYVRENGLTNSVIFTGYISDEERDCLYDNCSVFLYPSIFEGFGMPVIEAMERGVAVVTTKETSIYEVSRGKAIYVDDPYDEALWEEKVLEAELFTPEKIEFPEYNAEHIVGQYEKLFGELVF